MWTYIDKHYRTTPEVIAAKLAELQHAPGVTPYVGSDYLLIVPVLILLELAHRS